MKKDPRIQKAIDESLSSVRFDGRDMHRVLRAVRHQETPSRAPARKKRLRLDLAFAAATAVLVIAPLSLFALRAQRAPTSEIIPVAAHGQPAASAEPARGEDALLAPTPAVSAAPSDAAGETAVLRAARACFEAQCDTTVFSFEEYTVSTETLFDENGAPNACAVTMESVYDNGCTFRVVVSVPEGEVVSHSTPRLATVPTRIRSESEEVQAWYARYGRHVFTWPMDAQAEFSRRYEGGMLRMPREGEADAASVLARARELTGLPDEEALTFYATLCAERAFADGVARYQVYAFPGDIADGLPQVCTVFTFLASDGSFESSQTLSTSGL